MVPRKTARWEKKVPRMVINPETIMSQKPREDEVSRRMLSREPNSREGIKYTVKVAHCSLS